MVSLSRKSLIVAALVGALSAATIQNADARQFNSTEDLFEYVDASVCTIIAVGSDGETANRGSGFILKDSGMLVTNAHVLAGLDRAQVSCGNQFTDIRRITRYDPEVDLVVAEIGEIDVPGLSLSSRDEIRPGTQIYVFGSPYGFDGTISPGLTSGERTLEGKTYLQISAPISAGSSGGPVTDGSGDVIGVTVASLDIAQNINFALPSDAIQSLPAADIPLVGVLQSAPVGAVQIETDDETSDEGFVASSSAVFRGHAFGSACGDVARTEYQRRRAVPGSGGRPKFQDWYHGTLELDVNLFDSQATAYYRCDQMFGMVGGYYRIHGDDDLVNRLEAVLSNEHGGGLTNPITEDEAHDMGCRWNRSLPGSRNYRPSTRRTWDVDARFRIEMVVCGGKSLSTFVFYSDPILEQSVIDAGDRWTRVDL